ncbi:MAG TPA: thiamine pyrophosphate-dependent dehydrogenase E1 component subunit alpha [Pseudolysinimonas sp.]|nr:thiamine pyrophosphate-dependent dehydrogenase E1 component subunit alpha [Pseudolysinimonas sp.]
MSDRRDESMARRSELADPLGRYRRMVEIRLTEDIIKDLFASGLVAGTTHTCQGQEAVAVGVASVLRPTDMVCCTYRGHGHALALGMPPVAVLGEILGREIGCVGGLGGSMHLSDRDIGLMPTMAIIGAGIPIAAGVAWAAQLRGRDDVGVSLFGDGASNIGAFHEALNIAALWKLPAVFICENNLYGEYSPLAATTSVTDIAVRGTAYGMRSQIVDGQDLEAVMAAVGDAVGHARAGEGPTLIEMKTYRFAGHSRSDLATYRPEGELEAWLARDPIVIEGERLIAAGAATADALAALRADVETGVKLAVEAASASPAPGRPEMFRHVTA